MSDPVELILNRNIREVRSVTGAILDELRTRKVDDAVCFEIKVALREALANAVEHCDSNLSEAAKVRYWFSENNVIIEIEGRGKGFDVSSLSDPTTADNILKTRGRGIYLIKKFMDEVSFYNRGRLIRMVKKLVV